MACRADDVHIVVSMTKRGGEQFVGNVQFALSFLDVQITVRRKLPAKAVHRCCTYRRVNDDNWWQTYSRECSDRLLSWSKLVANEIALSTFDEDCWRTYSRLLYIRVYDENWYVVHQLIHEMEIGVRSADSRKWTDRRSETEREKNPSLSSALRNSLSAMSPLRCSLALSQREISRETSGTRIAVKHFADDLKFIEQVVHTDGQGHSHRRFRGRLCSSLTACRTTKVVLRALRTFR